MKQTVKINKWLSSQIRYFHPFTYLPNISTVILSKQALNIPSEIYDFFDKRIISLIQSNFFTLAFRGETIHHASGYIVIQSSRYVSWYRKIDEDTYRFCIIYSILLRLLLKNLNIYKNSIYYMYPIVVVSWDLYRDLYRIVAIPYRFTPTGSLNNLSAIWNECHDINFINSCQYSQADIISVHRYNKWLINRHISQQWWQESNAQEVLNSLAPGRFQSNFR